MLFLGGHILTSIWTVVMERREPASGLAWIMFLLLVPGVGLVAYHVVGRRWKRRVRRRLVQLAPSLLSDQHLVHQQEILTRLPDGVARQLLLFNYPRRPTTRGNRLKLLEDASAFYPELTAAIESAQTAVFLEFYIFRADATGRALLELLARKAAQGVAIRLLLDGLGSFWMDRKTLDPLVRAGGKVAFFLPPHFPRTNPEHINFRNHRKLACIDHQTAFTGGINIGDEYLGTNPSIGPWRDTQLRLDGPAVAIMEKVFLDDWLMADGQPFTIPVAPTPFTGGDAWVQVLPSGPDSSSTGIHESLFLAITAARHRVFLTSPYFVPDPSISMALRTAAGRGVDVRILLPSRSDLPVVQAAGRSYYPELLHAGVSIFEYASGFVHAKTLVVDGLVSSIGSANMDIRSFRLNFELNVICCDQELAATLEQSFLRDQRQALKVDLRAFQHRPVAQAFGENVARLLSPLL